ncbi:hypothetical protein DC522_10605 [Microvirga sp. KLBC 81]|uniref:hypothetical protein n=1 Tax=Microvirga sp. KLBC 81 TaxID=1862707 RepID=UPI000D5192B1|nr:hypothetical protein [Microvirga sp. KLBC 81]PVE24521.1 hypothetical protein DC522_10605 [Microvirga sp. KLBC 81]
MGKLSDFIKEFSRPDPSQEQAHERTWYAVTGSVVILVFWMHREGLFSDFMPIAMCVALAIVFWRGERGIHPYNARHRVGKKGQFLLTAIIFLGVGVALLNSAPANWYPTPSPYWIAIPYAVFVLLSALRGWWMN